VLAFPGVFRGALDAGARRITEGMKLAAAEGIPVAVSGASVRRPVNAPSAVTKPDSHVYGKRGPGDRLARNRTCRGLGNR